MAEANPPLYEFSLNTEQYLIVKTALCGNNLTNYNIKPNRALLSVAQRMRPLAIYRLSANSELPGATGATVDGQTRKCKFV